MFTNFEIFNQVMNQCTENYECLVIDCKTQINKIEDQVFWYKASPRPNFKIGSQLFWEQQQREADSSDDDGNNIDNMQRHKVHVNVVKNY